MKRIVLIGFRGSGKTSVGRKLAETLSLPFIDTDTLIEEQTGMTITDIFASEGEREFRRYERNVVISLPVEECVISTGGGVVLDWENVRHLRKDSMVFYLEAPELVILKRITGSDRPALTTLNLKEEVHTLLEARTPAYIRAADICIDTKRDTIETICDKILHILREGTVQGEDRNRAIEFFSRTGLPPGEWQSLEPVLAGCDNSSTRICAIVGNPCSHSRSPVLYNHLFSHFGLNYYYTRIQWHELDTIMHYVRRLDMRGLSITIPFKQSILRYLDNVDEHAGAIGAVNTVVQCRGKLSGSNTDWIGIQRPLSSHGGKDAVVLGAGGAAAAAVYALQQMGMNVTILNRTVERAAILAHRFDCGFGPLEMFGDICPDVVINATPVGMGSDGRTLLTREQMDGSMTVFDLVYTPPETPLLREARIAGCTCIPGEEMFIHQACEQFRAFTGIEVDPETVREMMK